MELAAMQCLRQEWILSAGLKACLQKNVWIKVSTILHAHVENHIH